MNAQDHVEPVFLLIEKYAKKHDVPPTMMQHTLEHILAIWICTTAGTNTQSAKAYEAVITRAIRITEAVIRSTALKEPGGPNMQLSEEFRAASEPFLALLQGGSGHA